ncbi:hypothetical protein GCM10010530_07940 [Kribbella aluminosa]
MQRVRAEGLDDPVQGPVRRVGGRFDGHDKGRRRDRRLRAGPPLYPTVHTVRIDVLAEIALSDPTKRPIILVAWTKARRPFADPL